MNTTKSVYNRLFAEDKVELASERVELAGYNFKAYKADYDKLFNVYRDNFRSAINASLKAVTNYEQNLFDLQRTMDAEYKDLVAKAKELGMTVEGSPKQKEYNEMTEILNKAKSNADRKGKDVSVLM
jgi:flagellar motility protein MotE (MotC chaperone)